MTSPIRSLGLRLAGILWVAAADPAQPPIKKVAQRVGLGLGNVPGDPARRQQIRAHVIPLDPKTPAQLARRAHFAAAMAAWASLDPSQRAAWNADARPLKISGVNLYVRKFPG
jgi:hypothetical protein